MHDHMLCREAPSFARRTVGDRTNVTEGLAQCCAGCTAGSIGLPKAQRVHVSPCM